MGRFVLEGASPDQATWLLETIFSGPMMAALGPAMLAFFAGTATFAIPLMGGGGGMAWAATLILAGVLLILAEIVSARVVLSQVGNVLAFCGSALAARLVLRGEVRVGR